jgi:hypothetical protein
LFTSPLQEWPEDFALLIQCIRQWAELAGHGRPSDESENMSDSIRISRELDSNETDESDIHFENKTIQEFQ